MNKIALIVDMPYWAFDIEAKLLKEKLQDFYSIDVICANDEKYDNNLFLILENVRNYDIIHFFWRKLLIQFNSEEFKLQVTQNGYDYNDYVNYFKTRISTGIYDHLFLEEDEIKLYEPIYTNFRHYLLLIIILFLFLRQIQGFHTIFYILLCIPY